MTSAISLKRDKNSIYHGEAYFRPLVKVHPETGRKSLFIGRHAFGIPGMVRERAETYSRPCCRRLLVMRAAYTPSLERRGRACLG